MMQYHLQSNLLPDQRTQTNQKCDLQKQCGIRVQNLLTMLFTQESQYLASRMAFSSRLLSNRNYRNSSSHTTFLSLLLIHQGCHQIKEDSFSVCNHPLKRSFDTFLIVRQIYIIMIIFNLYYLF